MTVSKIMLLKFTEATSIDLIEIRMVVLLVLGLYIHLNLALGC
jgi:hypothetical protein